MAKKPKRLRQIDTVTIHCVVCFNQGKCEPAFTVINKYAVCEPHVLLVSHPTFDAMSLRGGVKEKRATAT